jgi:hypothetical protein
MHLDSVQSWSAFIYSGWPGLFPNSQNVCRAPEIICGDEAMWQIPDLCYMMRKKSRQLSHYSEKLVIAYLADQHLMVFHCTSSVYGDCHTYKVCFKASGRAIVVRDSNHFEGGDIPAVCISVLVAGPSF